MKICSIEGCNKKHKGLGYCQKHYRAFKKYGDPLFAVIETHNMRYTSEYRSWRSMKTRCLNKNTPYYHRYGGRGITVCDRWKDSFSAFYEDMGDKPFLNAQIDRINNDGNYEPSNCRWVAAAENGHNRNSNILNWDVVKEIRDLFENKNMTQSELAVIFNINYGHIHQIVRYKTWLK